MSSVNLKKMRKKSANSENIGGRALVRIRDDPIISAMERSGYPPWFPMGGENGEEGGEENGQL